MLQHPEDTLLMIEGKVDCKYTNSYSTVSTLGMYKVKICVEVVLGVCSDDHKGILKEQKNSAGTVSYCCPNR